MARSFLAFLLLIGWALPATAATATPEKRPSFRHITPNQGLSARYVPAILQDHLGFLWFGTAEGLNRYDGYTFTVYRGAPDDPKGLTNGSVNALLEDREKRLWIGTANGLNRLDPETGDFVQYFGFPSGAETERFGRIQDLLEDPDGELWIGSLDGLFRMDMDSGAVRRFRSDPADPASLSAERVFCLEADSRGGIWVGTANGLNRLDPQTSRFTRYLHKSGDPDGLSHPDVRALFSDEEGLWVGTDGGGLDRLDFETGRFRHFRSRPEEPASLSSDLIRFIHRDRSGNLWIGTMGGGLNLWNARTERFVAIRARRGSSDGVGSDNLIAMAEDRAGNLWMGTMDAGISRMDSMEGRFRLYRPGADHPGFVDRQITYLAEETKETLLVATRSGELIRFHPAAERFEPVRPGGRAFSEKPLFPLLVDSKGILWVGTWGDGLIAHDRATGRKTHYRHDPDDPGSIGHNLVAAIQEGPEGNIWVGTWGGGLNRLGRERRRFIRFRHAPDDPESLADDRVMDLLFDRNGALWVSVVGRGMDRHIPGQSQFVHYPPVRSESGDPLGNSVYALFEDRKGRLWAGTNQGLCRRGAAGGFECATVSDGLPNNTVQGILEDDTGHLWVGTSNGLSRFDPDTGEFRNFDRRDGLQANDFNIRAAAKSGDGTLYFGGNGGLNRFRPEEIRDNPYMPPVALTELRVFNQPVTPGDESPLKRPIHAAEEIVLRPDQSIFAIEFAALNFSIPEKNQYAYRMSDVNPDWVHVGADRRFATYTNLAPGQYLFEVRGSNNDGLWNEEGASIRVRVLPPWWATLWFRTLALLFSGFALAAGFRWRVRSIRNRNRELVAEVSRRTLDLESINRHLLETMGEQERIAEALRESEERFRLAFENASVGICLVDMEGRFTRINRRMVEVFGYEPDELTGMSVNDITHPEDVDRSPEFIRKALAGEATTGEFEKRYFRKDGELIWGRVVSSLARNTAGEPLYFISHVEDITERKVAADALRASHERFAAVMDGINSLMYVADLETYRVLFANRAFRERFGEVEGRICWQVIQDGMDGPCGFCTNLRLLDDRGKAVGVVRWELRNTRNRRWYRIEDQAIPWVDGRLVRMSFATDITGLKEAEASLREARDAAESANRAKSRFLASIGHEIRTPMNAILGFADLLLARETDPRKRDSLTTLRDSGYALLRLLNDLLDLSRIEAGRLDLRPESCRPISLLAETRKLFRPEAERKSLSFALDTTELPDVAVRMDPVRFRQILTNLTGNALKYTRAGGIRIGARGRILGDRFRLSIEIADTGLGIPAESLGEVFDAFTRAHVDIPDAAGGTGLGLAISRELAERMGGNLMVASTDGVGTGFRLLLPAVPMDGARETEPGIAPAIEHGGDAGPSPLFPDPASDTDLAAAVSGMVPESPEAGPPAKTAEPEQPAAADDRLRRLGESLAPLWEKARRKQYMPDIQAFAEAMRAEAADVPALAAYANALLAEIQSYDVPAILARLEAFPARPDPGTASVPPSPEG